MNGNVIEWVEACWKENFRRRVLRGGSWYDNPRLLRSADCDRNDTGNRNNNGFRMARPLD